MPRERVLCVADNEQDALVQLAAVMATGCEVLWPEAPCIAIWLNSCRRRSRSAFALRKPISCLTRPFDAVIYHGDSDQLRELCEQVAARDGAIVSVQGFARGETNLLLERLYDRALAER